MEYSKVTGTPVDFNDLHKRITIHSLAGIRPAAEALRSAAHDMARLRVAACANIAGS